MLSVDHHCARRGGAWKGFGMKPPKLCRILGPLIPLKR